MEKYLKVYDTLNKNIIYDFRLGSGGVGDLTKFFMHLLNICIDKNIKIHYLINSTYVEKYLKLVHSKMYITSETISKYKNHVIQRPSDIDNMKNHDYYIIEPFALYESFRAEENHNYHMKSYNAITIPLRELFYFSEEVKVHTLLNNTTYISLHLRMGDKYLETDKQFVLCREDSRHFYEANICDFIEANQDKKILFCCDNNSYKLKLKKKYNQIMITDFVIGHTSLSNTTENEVLNALKEFYLLSNSEELYAASFGGFSIMASKFKQIPVFQLF